jgi:phosphatidylglycerophosphate synthase
VAAEVRSGALTEGELWTRQQLAELLARRFSPVAVAEFLAASQRRANDVRARRPALGRQSRRWGLAGAAAWLGLAAAGRQPFRGNLVEGLTWWALTWTMLDWHLGMVETEDGRPRPLGPADALTLARVWLAPVVIDRPGATLATAGFATDVLDGMAARSLGEPTRAGRDLEGLADACFAAALLVGLRRHDAIGRAASAAELTRLGAGFAYSVAVYFARVEPPDRELTRAARPTAALRAAGMLAATVGRRGAGTALVGAGCAWSIALVGRALRR